MRIAEFIAQSIEQTGGTADTRAPNLMDVLLPPPLEERLGESLVTLALDTEALTPPAQLATLGSPFMDTLIAFVGERGTTTFGYLPVERIKKKGLRDEVARALTFANCRLRYDESEPDLRNCATLQFNFKVTFASDERRERLYVVPVNLWSNQANLLLAERLPALEIVESDPLRLTETPRVLLEDAYKTARDAVRRQADEETARHKARMKKRFSVEFSRIDDYYAQVTEELLKRKARETDEPRLRTLVQKMDAAQEERERKLRELGEKYRLRLRAQLTSARLLVQPKSFFRLFIDKGKTTRTLTLAYDSLLERLEPPVCESCHQEMTRIRVTPFAQLVCPRCEERGSHPSES